MPRPLEDSYKALSAAAKTSLTADAAREALLDCISQSLDLLRAAERVDLQSSVPGKRYFAFRLASSKVRDSRGVNESLFLDDRAQVIETIRSLSNGIVPPDPADLHAALYTAAISYPAGTDLTKDGDKKSPGTYFENFVGHLVARVLDVEPTKSITAPTLDLSVNLPTDFVFDLGPGKSRIHMPIKASTRERVIQVWAHQRVLDGMHGVNRFRGLLVVLAETNRKGATGITEVCLPGQWIAYQMYIAQLHRVYYLDLPEKYKALNEAYPFLNVLPFANFFYEYDNIARPTSQASTL